MPPKMPNAGELAQYYTREDVIPEPPMHDNTREGYLARAKAMEAQNRSVGMLESAFPLDLSREGIDKDMDSRKQKEIAGIQRMMNNSVAEAMQDEDQFTQYMTKANPHLGPAAIQALVNKTPTHSGFLPKVSPASKEAEDSAINEQLRWLTELTKLKQGLSGTAPMKQGLQRPPMSPEELNQAMKQAESYSNQLWGQGQVEAHKALMKGLGDYPRAQGLTPSSAPRGLGSTSGDNPSMITPTVSNFKGL